MSSVVIAEKKEQAQKYAYALGLIPATEAKEESKATTYYKGRSTLLNDEVAVTAAQGHLFQTFVPEEYDEKYKKWSLANLPIFPEKFKNKADPKTKRLLNKFLEAAKNSDTLIIGTDIDREGELIAYEMIHRVKDFEKKTIKRLWVNDMTHENLMSGFKNLKPASYSYDHYIEAETRQQADWLVGMNLSVFYTLKYGEMFDERQTLSVGRVQTPAVWLVKQREDKIKNWKYDKYKQLTLCVTKDGHTVEFKSERKFKDIDEFNQAITDSELKTIQQVQISEAFTESKTKDSPKLFNISSIGTYAKNIYGFKMKHTEDVLQELHMSENLSYPRTEISLVTENVYKDLVELYPRLQKFLGWSQDLIEPVNKKAYVNDSKVKEHYANTPTKNLPSLDKLNIDQKKIYLAVVRRVVMMFAGQYKYQHTKNVINVGNFTFVNTRNVTTNMGWRSLEEKKSKPKSVDDISDISFTEGETLTDFKFLVIDGVEQPPAHLNEATLSGENSLMEKAGLGKPATRTAIVNRIQQIGYLREVTEKRKSYLTITEKGRALCRMVEGNLLSKPEWTGGWEVELANIGEGRVGNQFFLKTIHEYILATLQKPLGIDQREIAEVKERILSEKMLGVCPVCKVGHLLDRNNKLAVCDRPDCKFKLFYKTCGKKLTKNQINQLINDGRTRSEVNKLVSKSGKNYDAVLRVDVDAKRVAPVFE